MSRSVNSNFFVSDITPSFSWEILQRSQPNDGFLIADNPVFRVLDKDSPEFSVRSEHTDGYVQELENGLILIKPKSGHDGPACEMSFQMESINCKYRVYEVLIISEARNLELYVNEVYENTVKGSKIWSDREKSECVYQCRVRLSEFLVSGKVAKIKFLSMPSKNQMKLIAVTFGVTKLKLDSQYVKNMVLKTVNPRTVDMDYVKSMLASISFSLSGNAEKLMGEIDQQQQVQAAQLQHVLALGSNINENHIVDREVERLKFQGLPKDNMHGVGAVIPKVSEGMPTDAYFESRASVSPEKAIGVIPFCKTETQQTEIDPLVELLPLQSESADTNVHDSISLNPRDNTSHHIRQEETFTQLLSSYLTQTEDDDKGSRINPNSSKIGDRWRAYLKSRIRASQKLAVESGTRKKDSPLEFQWPSAKRCQECGCPGCLLLYGSIAANFSALEERLMTRIERRIQDLFQHIDTRLEYLQNVLLDKKFKDFEESCGTDRPEAEMEEAHSSYGVFKSEV